MTPEPSKHESDRPDIATWIIVFAALIFLVVGVPALGSLLFD